MPRGSIVERSKGVYQVQVSAGTDPETGRRKRLTSTIRGSKAAANRELTRLLGEVDQGAHRGPDASLGRLLDRWWAKAQHRWAPATRRGYMGYRKLYLDPHADVVLSKITPEWLDDLYATLLDRLAPATVYKVHAMLHDALDDAVRWGWLAWNPTDRADPPKVKRRPITVPERKAVVAAIAKVAELDPDYSAMLHLQAVAGLRRAELAGLQWRDLTGDLLLIRRTVVLDEKDLLTVQETTKSHRSRTIPLDPGTLAVLAAHRERRAWAAEQLGVTDAPTSFMFPRRADSTIPMDPLQVTRRWARWRNDLDLKGVRLHDFRHAMVTHLLDQGVPVHDVAARAGHAHGNVTLSIYAHPTSEGAKRAGKVAGL